MLGPQPLAPPAEEELFLPPDVISDCDVSVGGSPLLLPSSPATTDSQPDLPPDVLSEDEPDDQKACNDCKFKCATKFQLEAAQSRERIMNLSDPDQAMAIFQALTRVAQEEDGGTRSLKNPRFTLGTARVCKVFWQFAHHCSDYQYRRFKKQVEAGRMQPLLEHAPAMAKPKLMTARADAWLLELYLHFAEPCPADVDHPEAELPLEIQPEHPLWDVGLQLADTRTVAKNT